MKKIIYLVFISIIFVGTIFSIVSYEKTRSSLGKTDTSLNKAQASKLSQPALPAADWPVYDFDTLVKKADCIVLADVYKNEGKKDGEGPPAILSTLKVTDVLYGSAPNSIILDQTNNIVEQGKSYLLFLYKYGDYYYELSEQSVVVGDRDEYKVEIEGLKGVYKKQDLIQRIKTVIKSP